MAACKALAAVVDLQVLVEVCLLGEAEVATLMVT